jgi:hypothetical protein
MTLGLGACDGEVGREEPRVVKLVEGPAQLIGLGSAACSRSAEAPGGRWCGFFRAGAAPDSTELWVVNVTRALAGEAIPCDGSSDGCLRLTDRLYTGIKLQSYSHPEGHRFEGDTLLYLADAHPGSAALDRYEGLVWAWRPGWRAPRALTSDRGVLCRASAEIPYALCVDGATDRPRLEFDLRAGRLEDREDATLPLIERIAPLQGGSVVWSAELSAAADAFVYSSWRAGEPGETLRMIPLRDLGTAPARDVVTEGTRWSISGDGRGVYFLRGVGSNRPGTLWSADFPGGGALARIADDVSWFQPLGVPRRQASGVAVLSDLRGFEGSLYLHRDRARPESRTKVADDVHAWYLSEDERFTFILQVDGQGERGLLADNDRGTTCRLGSSAAVSVNAASFAGSLDAVFWDEPDPDDETRDVTFLGRPGDCTGARLVGTQVDYLLHVGARSLVFGARVGDEPVSLRFAPKVDPMARRIESQVVVPNVDLEHIAAVGAVPEAVVAGTRTPEGRHDDIVVFGPLR